MPIVFGEFTLDEKRRQLLKRKEPVRLSPKGFQLLSILIEASPSAVSKADLHEKLWPKTFVTEASLATLVTELRSALGDDARDPRFIRTLYGFGYSFTAATTAAAPPPQPARRLGHLTGAASFGAVAALLLLASRSMTGSAAATSYAQPIRSIAVLPFDTTGADHADQHLGLGLPDLVITRLTNVHDIIVRPTSAVREFDGHVADSEKIGRKLRVDAVIEGSIRTSPDRVRVTVQMLDVRDNKPVWADRFDEKRGDIFTIEDGMATKVAGALRLQLTADEKVLLGKRYTSNPEAYQNYVQGRYHLEEAGPGRYYANEPQQAIEFFQKAIDHDPHFAAAWASMSLAYVFSAELAAFGPQSRHAAWAHARECARKAIELDPMLSDPYATLADVAAAVDFQFDNALQLYDRAIELNPRDRYAVLRDAYLLQCLGRFDQSIALRKRFIEIDPVSINAQWGLANAYLTSGQNDLAAKQVQVVLGMDPHYAEAHIALIRLAVARGDFDAAITEARSQTAATGDVRALSFLGYALGRAGHTDEARSVLDQLTTRSTRENKPLYFQRAVVYAGLGEADAAIALLEKGVDDREYALRLKTEPVFLPFHSNPRFIALLQRVGFKD
ncbi:MAG TPA: winged helix-turn-helix domain-containing protein [Thermoanaerobaculia bacterium]|nr:winged helix-turn-helix domain-containing protein [Thermoanaerobaculia bacterium]